MSELDYKQSTWVIEQLKNYNVIFVGIHGSLLYGLDHEDSDTDIKAIYLPSKTDLILGKAVNTVNKKNDELDIEIEIKSLSSFLKSAASCDTNCVDLLHSPEDMILYKTGLWDEMVKHRSNLYAKNMKGTVGYIKTHSKKYTNKIDRLNEMKKLKDLVSTCEIVHGTSDERTISDLIKLYKTSINKLKYVNPVTIVQDHEQQYLEVCGKKYIYTWSVDKLLAAMDNEIKRYGKRSNEGLGKGLDCKSLSHALRVLLELKEIIDTRNIQFPLREAEYVKSVKMGEITDVGEVMEKIDSLYEECMIMLEHSDLPEEVDLSPMYKVVEDHYFT